MNKIELLAPAGSLESLYAAVNAKADAVYVGGSKFSARAYAANFNNEEIKTAVDYCHSYNVKIYVTINICLKESELKEALKYAGYLYEIGVDALIVQDLGLFKLIKEKYIDFELHGSTQVTIHNEEGAVYFTEKGFKRIVLSRELSLPEIKRISKDLDIETEIFVHGALCVCYSGKCLMSSMIGDRSGNRGRCAQPCRKEYTIKSGSSQTKKGYLLSPKDMCTIDNMQDIIDTNTKSLKIEGRMKKPEYVAGVVKTYRAALDKQYYNRKFDLANGRRDLLKLFNREGFTTGYLIKNTGRDMMSYTFPKNTGVYLGKVSEDGNIILKEDISLGDGVRNNDTGFTVSKILLKGKETDSAKRGDKVTVFPKGYKKNDHLYLTSSKVLNNSLQDFSKKYEYKIPIDVSVEFIIGKPLKINTYIFGKEYVALGDMLEQAKNSPLSCERAIEGLTKSGDYPYRIEKVSFTAFEPGFVRISSLNNLRRQLFEIIIKYQTAKYRRNRNNITENNIITNKTENIDIEMLFTCTTKEQLQSLTEYKPKTIGADIFSKGKDKLKEEDILKINGFEIYLVIPDIIKQEFNFVVAKINKLKDKISGIITSNAGIINHFRGKINIIGDCKLNIFNSQSLEFYLADINKTVLSTELSKSEIKEMVKGNANRTLVQIYGKSELMVSEYCPIGSTFGGKTSEKDCNNACLSDNYKIIDGMKKEFNIMTDVFCRSHILNTVPLNLIGEIDSLKAININSFKVDFKDENSEEVKRVLDYISGKTKIDDSLYTKGHFRRGVE